MEFFLKKPPDLRGFFIFRLPADPVGAINSSLADRGRDSALSCDAPPSEPVRADLPHTALQLML